MNKTPPINQERDAALDAAYRAAAPDEPPPALDDAIRAAARRAVGAGPLRRGSPLRRWQLPLSIAAVLVLCVSLVAVMREDGSELTRVPRAEAPAAVAAADRAKLTEPAIPRVELAPATGASGLGLKPSAGGDGFGLGRSASSAGIRAPATALPEARDTDRLAAAAPARRQDFKASEPAAPAVAEEVRGRLADNAPVLAQREAAKPAAPAAAAVAESKLEAVPLDREADRKVRADAPMLAKIAPVAPAPAAMRAAPAQAKADSAEPAVMSGQNANQVADGVAQMSLLPPDKWLDRIEELRRAGRVEEARAGLSGFRRRYPDFKLPPSLQNLASP
jgi:hypothetical protein